MTKKITSFQKGILSMILALLCFSTVEVFGTFILKEGANPLTLLTLRMITASFFLLITIKFKKYKIFNIEKTDFLRLLLHSFILSLHLILFWQGVKLLNNIPSVVLLFASVPIWTILISFIFLKERLNLMKVFSLLFGILGIVFVIGLKTNININLIGGITMLFASLLWSIYIIVGRKLLEKYNGFSILFYNFLFSFFFFICIQSPAITIEELSPRIAVYILLLSLVSTYFAYSFHYYALLKLKASKLSIIGLLKPVFSIILAGLIFSQTLNLYQSLGGLFILIGVCLIRKEEDEEIKTYKIK